jgi:hypothetical protein
LSKTRRARGRVPVLVEAEGQETTLSIALGDLDADGHQDVVTRGGLPGVLSATLSTRLNQGTGALGALATFSVGRALGAPAVGDVDGDDKPEFVVPDSGGWTTPEQGRVWVLKATSNGSFAAKDYDVGFSASSVAVGDLNGDGKADIVASGQDGVHVLLNDGSGQFPTVAKYAAGIYGVALADLDGDGKPDIVGGGSVMFNIGSGAFAVAKSLDINGAGLQFADLNGDGKVDAAAVSYSCAGIILYLNDGKGALRPSYRLPDAVQPSSPLLTLSDVSGDGSPDLVIVNGSTLSVRLHK